MARNENMIAALKRERAIYVSQGDEDRVRQVDDSLRHYGYAPDSADEQDGPKRRTAPQKQTADGTGQTSEDGSAAQAAKKTAAKKTTAAPPTE